MAAGVETKVTGATAGRRRRNKVTVADVGLKIAERRCSQTDAAFCAAFRKAVTVGRGVAYRHGKHVILVRVLEVDADHGSARLAQVHVRAESGKVYWLSAWDIMQAMDYWENR